MGLFVRIVDTGGIARAAESLGIPNATATTLLQRLEASLGVKLLNRTTRRISVTPDGAAYYTRAAAILAEVRDAEEALSQHSAAPRGRVRVDVPTLIARAVIVPALPRFFAQYPDIELALACNERHFDLSQKGSTARFGWETSTTRVWLPGASAFCISRPVPHRRISVHTACPLIHASWRDIGVSTTSQRARERPWNGFFPRELNGCNQCFQVTSRSRTKTAM